MTDKSFWDFSVRTYRTPGVPEACLSLQNEHGADVNMLLYCAWIGAAAGHFNDDLFDRTYEFSKNWAENVVKRLRFARTWMKESGCKTEPVDEEPCMKLREKIKSVEFGAEKLQQEALESMLSSGRTWNEAPDRLLDATLSNLMRYLATKEIPATEEVREKLSIIVCAAFPDLDPKVVRSGFAS